MRVKRVLPSWHGIIAPLRFLMLTSRQFRHDVISRLTRPVFTDAPRERAQIFTELPFRHEAEQNPPDNLLYRPSLRRVISQDLRQTDKPAPFVPITGHRALGAEASGIPINKSFIAIPYRPIIGAPYSI